MFLKLVSLLALFHNPYPVFSQDIEVEGVVRIGDSFLNQLRNSIDAKMEIENSESSLEENNLLFKSRKNQKTHKNRDFNSDKKTNNTMITGNHTMSKDSDVKLHVDSNIVDGKREDDENSAKEIDSSHESETIKKHLDTDKSEDTILIGIPFISNKDSNAEKSENKFYPQLYNKYFLKYSDTKETGLSNHTFKSTHNIRKKHHFIKKKHSDRLKKSDHENKESNNDDVHSKQERINKHYERNQTIRAKYEQNKHASEKKPVTDPRVKRFLEHMIYQEVENIEKIGKFLQEKLAFNKSELLSLLKASRTSYTTKMKRYVNYIINQKTNCDIDREYLYLDIVASANILLYSEERQLLNKMIDGNKNNVTLHELESLTEEIYKENVNQKKRDMLFMCEEIKVCRRYPGFSDYFAELISDVLKLSDNRLEVIVKIWTKLIKNRTNFFKSILKSNVADLIGEKLEALSKDLYNLRETFSVVRSIIIQRFKMMKTTDDHLRTRTKAVRILIDVIDKTFSSAGEDEMTVVTFDTAVQAIRHWALGKRDKVDIPLKLLLEQVVAVLSFNWEDSITDEVTMLTEVMMTGETDKKDMFKEVFSRGSPYFTSFPIF